MRTATYTAAQGNCDDDYACTSRRVSNNADISNNISGASQGQSLRVSIDIVCHLKYSRSHSLQ